MARYFTVLWAMEKNFVGITVQTIPRNNNEVANELAKIASSAQGPHPMCYEVLKTRGVALEVLAINTAETVD